MDKNKCINNHMEFNKGINKFRKIFSNKEEEVEVVLMQDQHKNKTSGNSYRTTKIPNL